MYVCMYVGVYDRICSDCYVYIIRRRKRQRQGVCVWWWWRGWRLGVGNVCGGGVGVWGGDRGVGGG